MSTDTEIFVVVPSGYGLILHLHSPRYQPGGQQSARKRDLAYPVALCNNRSIKHDTLVPLRDGLNLRRTTDGTGPAWRWCRVCIGHAAAIAGLEHQVLTWIATGREKKAMTPSAFHVMLRRRMLLDQRDLIEGRIGIARTVGDVWRLNTQLDAIDDQLADVTYPGAQP